MVEVIPPSVKRFWDEWNIRGIILFSLSLQILLFLLAPLRKATGKSFIIFLVWSSYLMADWAATFCIGLITAVQGNVLQTSISENTEMLAFWAPFLIFHLGGPDTITALALEDNELWLRNSLILISQAVAALYVFAETLPKNELWIPTTLMFIAGVIKYWERTRALFLASLERFRDSVISEPDMEDVQSMPHGKSCLSDVQVVLKGYQCFNIYKRIFVDLLISNMRSSDFFKSLEPESALRVMEAELNFMNDVMYTKVQVTRRIAGYLLRALAFGAVLASCGVFHSKVTKEGFRRFDVRVGYTLLLCAIALEFLALLKLFFSDWTLVSLLDDDQDHKDDDDDDDGGGVSTKQEIKVLWVKKLKHLLASILIFFLRCKSLRWRLSACLVDKRVRHHLVATPILFRRWSGSVSRFNLISYTLKSSPRRIYEFTGWTRVVIKLALRWSGIEFLLHNTFRCVNNKGISLAPYVWYIPINLLGVLGLRDSFDSIRFVSNDRFTKELWTFIFQEAKREIPSGSEAAYPSICFTRGYGSKLFYLYIPIPKKYKEEFNELLGIVVLEYDWSLLMLHIVTELYYNNDNDDADQKSNQGAEFNACDYREFSKMLSDYMAYLLVIKPTMVSAVAGIAKIRFKQTCAEVEQFLKKGRLGPKDLGKACKQILEVNTDTEPAHEQSVLFDACILAKKLIAMEEDNEMSKWKFLSIIWVQFLFHAAISCRPRTHVQQLCNGGELITFVWLLMVHLGDGEFFIERDFNREMERRARRPDV